MTTILLDADIVAYKVASLNQDTHDFGDTGIGLHLDEEKAIRDVEEIIGDYATTLDASRVVVCLSDPQRNFRKELWELYKANRKDVEKPLLLQWVKEYLYREYPSFIRPRLEADDVMGILATDSERFLKTSDVIMVSEDKDMRTVPARLYNPNRPELGTIEITEEEANRFHLWQTIVGDPVDGIKGVPGVGEKSIYATYLIEDAEPEEFWDVVLEAYASKGLTEDDAILNARLTHILWSSSYNNKTKKVRLWCPTWLQ